MLVASQILDAYYKGIRAMINQLFFELQKKIYIFKKLW